MTLLRKAMLDSLPKGMELEDIQEVIWRLLARGVVSRNARQTEAELYDRGAEASDLLIELFQLLGLTLRVDLLARTLRLFPPGAEVPGVDHVVGEPYAGLTLPVSTDLAACLLAAWLLYREGLERSLLNDQGERVLSLADYDACLANQLGTDVMSRVSDRRALLFELRKLRVVRLPEGVTEFDADIAFAIQRGILSLVHESAAQAALDARRAQ